MSTTQTVLLEIQKTDKKRNNFFKRQNELRSGPPLQLRLMEVKQFLKIIRRIPITAPVVAV